jgi:hypothetical protein
MREWKGVTRDESSASDGAMMASNVRFYIEGECGRRLPLQRQLTQSGTYGMATYGAPNGGQYAVLVVSSGNVQMVLTS